MKDPHYVHVTGPWLLLSCKVRLGIWLKSHCDINKNIFPKSIYITEWQKQTSNWCLWTVPLSVETEWSKFSECLCNPCSLAPNSQCINCTDSRFIKREDKCDISTQVKTFLIPTDVSSIVHLITYIFQLCWYGFTPPLKFTLCSVLHTQAEQKEKIY